MDNNYNENHLNQQTSYDGGQERQNPYSQQSAYGQNPYSQQSAYGQNPYGRNAYGQQEAARGVYGQTTGGYSPYQQTVKPQREKKKSGFGMKLVKCAAIALIFGLVSGAVFTGISYAGYQALGITGANEGGSSGGKTSGSALISGDNAYVQGTATGLAKDLADVSGIFDEVIPSIVAITNNGIITYQTFWGTQQY